MSRPDQSAESFLPTLRFRTPLFANVPPYTSMIESRGLVEVGVDGGVLETVRVNGQEPFRDILEAYQLTN